MLILLVKILFYNARPGCSYRRQNSRWSQLFHSPIKIRSNADLKEAFYICLNEINPVPLWLFRRGIQLGAILHWPAIILDDSLAHPAKGRKILVTLQYIAKANQRWLWIYADKRMHLTLPLSGRQGAEGGEA